MVVRSPKGPRKTSKRTKASSGMGTKSRTTRETVIYRINTSDVIVKFNYRFKAFAEMNHAPFRVNDVIGQPLWQFIFGADEQAIYKKAVELVRQRQRSLSFPYRCDSPHLRRYMRMRLVPFTNGEVEFRSTLLRSERRDETIYILMQKYGKAAVSFMCSMCNRVRLDSEDYVEISEALKAGLVDRDERVLVCYEVCKDCATSMAERFRNFRKKFHTSSSSNS